MLQLLKKWAFIILRILLSHILDSKLSFPNTLNFSTHQAKFSVPNFKFYTIILYFILLKTVKATTIFYSFKKYLTNNLF